jgi:hypothetical protein
MGCINAWHYCKKTKGLGFGVLLTRLMPHAVRGDYSVRRGQR